MTLLLLPAALLATTPALTPAEVLTEALEGVPECLVEGRGGHLEARLRYAREAWAARRDTLAKRIPPSDLARLDLAFLHMEGTGRAVAWAALDGLEVLADQLPLGPARHRSAARLVCLQAWFAADSSHWATPPDLEAAFAPLLGRGRPGSAGIQTRMALDQHRQAWNARNAPRCKGAARTLYGLVGTLD